MDQQLAAVLSAFQCPAQVNSQMPFCNLQSDCAFGHYSADPATFSQPLRPLPMYSCTGHLLGRCPFEKSAPVGSPGTVNRCPIGLHLTAADLLAPEHFANRLASTIMIHSCPQAQSTSAPSKQRPPEEPDQQCNICFEWIRASGRLFGLQELCPHSFCVDCILWWYTQPNPSCPVCNRPSKRILVWPHMVQSEEEKTRLVNLQTLVNQSRSHVEATVSPRSGSAQSVSSIATLSFDVPSRSDSPPASVFICSDSSESLSRNTDFFSVVGYSEDRS